MKFGKREIHISLLPRVIIAIILGLIAGNFLPAAIVRVFITFNSLFSEFLGFMIPLIIYNPQNEMFTIYKTKRY